MPAVAAFAVIMSGCDLEVQNPGSILDSDLTTPQLMPILVAGVSAEYNDIGDLYAFSTARLSDDIAGTGSYFGTQQYRQGIFDFEDSSGFWEQAHEAAWSAGEAWVRLQDVLPDASANALSSRLFMLMGHAHRVLGENFCDLVYDVGTSQARSVAFDSAIVAFNMAITIGTAAGSDADEYVMSARAGIAAAMVGLAVHGSGTWAVAAAQAALIPTDFVDAAIYHRQANSNQIWIETHNRAEVGVWGTRAQRLGDPSLTDPDPRTPYAICGTFDDPSDPSAGVTSTGDCAGSGSGAHQGADGLTAHYRQDKYPERGSDIPRVSGVEMRMIEAEEALLRDDYAAFIGFINDARASYGRNAADTGDVLPALTAPTTAGSLDWPYDDTLGDGWSILDEERYATLWLTGKRWYDLDRWNHPFLDGGFLAPNIPGASALARRASCMPVPKNECELNPNLQGDPICG